MNLIEPKWVPVEYFPTHSTGARQWIVRLGEKGRVLRGSIAGKAIRFRSLGSAQHRANQLNEEVAALSRIKGE